MIHRPTDDPGFVFALARNPAALKDCCDIFHSLGTGLLPARCRALIAVAVAQLSGCDYARWVHDIRAGKLGISAEDIALASCGCALEPRESALVALAWEMAAARAMVSRHELPPAKAARITEADVTEITANVMANLLTNEMLRAVAPRAGSRTSPRAA